MAIRQLSVFAEWEKTLQVTRSVLASNPQLYEILVGELLMKHSDNLVSVSKGQQVASMTVDPLEESWTMEERHSCDLIMRCAVETSCGNSERPPS